MLRLKKSCLFCYHVAFYTLDKIGSEIKTSSFIRDRSKHRVDTMSCLNILKLCLLHFDCDILGLQMIIEGNGVYDNRESGLLCKGNADIHDNDVVGNYAGGISLESRALCRVSARASNQYFCLYTVESVISD